MQVRAGSAGEEGGEPPFAVSDPVRPGRFVFASPHSGSVYPADMDADPALAHASLASAEDALVDRLIATGTDHGAVVVVGRFGRAYVDLNRDPTDLDPEMLVDAGPTEDAGISEVDAGQPAPDAGTIEPDAGPVAPRDVGLPECLNCETTKIRDGCNCNTVDPASFLVAFALLFALRRRG